MKLRKYKKEDANVVCSWIKDEKSLYQWSADRIGKYPLAAGDLNRNYEMAISNKGFIPLCAIDEKDEVIGHFFIRYPNEADTTTVRFGFVILDPALRGRVKGKEMLQLAIDYSRNVLGATVITLGVFTNNDAARHCYEAVGFSSVGKIETYKMDIGEWECIEMEMSI